MGEKKDIYVSHRISWLRTGGSEFERFDRALRKEMLGRIFCSVLVVRGKLMSDIRRPRKRLRAVGDGEILIMGLVRWVLSVMVHWEGGRSCHTSTQLCD